MTRRNAGCAAWIFFLLVIPVRPLLSAAQEAAGAINTITARIGTGWFYGDGLGGNFRDQQFSIDSGIGLQRAWQHTQWNLNYDARVGVDQLATQTREQTTQVLTADLEHNFTRRLSLSLGDHYTLSDNPMAISQTQQGQSELRATSPSQLSSFAVPLGQEVQNDVWGNLFYQTGPHSSIGLNAADSLRHFRGALANAGLINTNTASAGVFYARQVNRKNKIALSYTGADIRLEGNAAHSFDQRLFLRDDVAIRENMTLSVFAGPEHAHAYGSPLLSPDQAKLFLSNSPSHWFVSGGSAFAWQGKTLKVDLGWQRNVSDGGGFASVVRLNSLNGSVGRNLSRRWSAATQITYSTGGVIQGTTQTGTSRISTTQCGVWMTRTLKPNLIAWAGYARVWFSTGVSNPQFPGNYNLTQAGLTFWMMRRPW
jgi:hypothetical protein